MLKLWDLLNLIFPQIGQFASVCKDNFPLLKHKAEFIAGILLDYKTQMTQDRVLNASMYQKMETFFRGRFIVHKSAWFYTSLVLQYVFELKYTEVVHSSGLYSWCLLAIIYNMKVGAVVNECYDTSPFF